MNKDIGEIDFIALANTWENHKESNGQDDKKEKRFWLRQELYMIYGASHIGEMEETFSWIYNAPLKDWKNMVLTLRMTYPQVCTQFSLPNLEKAKELFAFLS